MGVEVKGNNFVYLRGNLTKDPIVKKLTSGSIVVEVGIAVNEKEWTDKNGVIQRPVHFFDVEAFSPTADTLAKYKKGSPIIVEGLLRQDRWENAEGKKMSKVVVKCLRHSVPDFKKGEQVTEQKEPELQVAVGSSDNVPF